MSLKSHDQKQKIAEAKSERARVVFLLNSFGIGGIERQLLAQLHHYSRDKYELHLVTLYNYPDRPTLYNQLPKDIQVHQFHCIYGKANLIELWKVAQLLRELKPRLVVSSMFGPNAFNRITSLWLRHIPLAREHNTYTDRKLLPRMIERACSYLSPTIVAVSNEVADFTAKQSWFSRDKYTVIQNGVDLDSIEAGRKEQKELAEKLKAQFAILPETCVWLNVARLKKQKNHDLLIDAFIEYLKKYPDDRLFILGDGQEGERLLRKVSELQLESRIHLLGYRADVFAFYELANYFILTSDIEGFPNVVLEAMAFGLPVLSTNVAGINEIIIEEENGFVIERSIHSVRDTMIRVRTLWGDNYQTLSLGATEAVQCFSMKQTVARYEALFDSLLENIHERN